MKNAGPRKGRLSGGDNKNLANTSLTAGTAPVNDLPVDALRRRPVRPEEIPDLRAIYWNLRREGVRLPAERGVIVLEGGRP